MLNSLPYLVSGSLLSRKYEKKFLIDNGDNRYKKSCVFFFFLLKWKSFFRILEIFLKLSFSFPAIIITLILFNKKKFDIYLKKEFFKIFIYKF